MDGSILEMRPPQRATARRGLDRHRLRDHAFGAEHATIARDLFGRPEHLVGIVGELDRRPPVDVGDFADDRDRLQFAVDPVGRAALEVVGEVGAPAD